MVLLVEGEAEDDEEEDSGVTDNYWLQILQNSASELQDGSVGITS